MNSLLQTFESPLTACLRSFAEFLATRHSSIKNVDKEVQAFLNDPKAVASKIASLKEDESESEVEVKTRVVDSEDESEEPQVANKKKIVVESESSSDDSEEPPKKASAKDSDSDSEADESDDDASPPPVEDDDEDEPKPKGKKTAKPAAKKGSAKTSKSGEMELSDTPKLATKDRPAKMPKGIKFLKGSNNVVVNSVVVASISKKGIGKLTKTNIKPLDEKGIKYEEWDDAKIKKHFKL